MQTQTTGVIWMFEPIDKSQQSVIPAPIQRGVKEGMKPEVIFLMWL